MTEDEFQDKYYDYMVHDRAEAEAECAVVKAAGVDAVAVKFSGVWCLMLRTAYDCVSGLGIKSEEE